MGVTGAVPVLVVAGDRLDHVLAEVELLGGAGAVDCVLDEAFDQLRRIADAEGGFFRREQGQRGEVLRSSLRATAARPAPEAITPTSWTSPACMAESRVGAS